MDNDFEAAEFLNSFKNPPSSVGKFVDAALAKKPPSTIAELHAAAAHAAGPPLGRAQLITLESLKMEPIDWLWAGWLAHGKIHLIAGVPEAGKTSLALKLGATLSSGDHWPDGTKAKPGNVLIWTGEDDPAQTIKPRLIQMGSDPKKIWIVKATLDENGKPRPFNPQTDLPVLALAANKYPEASTS